MTPEHTDLLTVNRVEIVEDLLVDDVLNFLQSKLMFDGHDTELVKAEKTSRRQAEKLLDLLSTKSDAAFYCFRESLEEPYPHLVELLQENVKIPRKISDAKDLLERGKYVLKVVTRHCVSERSVGFISGICKDLSSQSSTLAKGNPNPDPMKFNTHKT